MDGWMDGWMERAMMLVEGKGDWRKGEAVD